MHLYMITRGIKQDVERFIRDLEAQYLPYKMDAGTIGIQLQVRPIQLWEIAFCKENLPVVLKTVGNPGYETTIRPDINLKFQILRKIFKAKKIPPLDLKDVKPLTMFGLHSSPPANIAVYPFGIKEDGIFTEGRQKGGERI